MKAGPYLAAAAVALVVILGAAILASFASSPTYALPKVGLNVTLPAGLPYRQLTTGSWDDRWPAWSPDGKSIAYVTSKGVGQTLQIMTASGANSTQASPGDELVAYPAWNPGSTAIAYWAMNGQTSEIRVYNVTTNSTFTLPDSSPGAIQTLPAWSLTAWASPSSQGLPPTSSPYTA